MLDRTGAADRENTPAPDLGATRGASPTGVPIEPAPRTPPVDGRSEWRGTLTEAIRQSAERNGVTGFASADWASQPTLRVMTPQDLSGSIERAHAQVAPGVAPPRAYTVGQDGTIYNTVTNRAEYVPVQATGSARDIRNDIPRIQGEMRDTVIAQRMVDARTNHRLPDVDGLNTSQRAGLYTQMYLQGTDAKGREAFQAGQKVIYSMRVPTDVNANNGHGIYDDRVVVIQRREDGSTALLYEGKITTDPSGRYEDQGPYQAPGKVEGKDVDLDGRRDLGRLQAGQSYEFMWSHGDEAKFGPHIWNGTDFNVLRPTSSVPADRDANHDGRFDGADRALYRSKAAQSADDSVLFHQGGELKSSGSDLPATNTFSGGCQTMPKSEFRGSFASALDPAAGQTRFRYTIEEM